MKAWRIGTGLAVGLLTVVALHLAVDLPSPKPEPPAPCAAGMLPVPGEGAKRSEAQQACFDSMARLACHPEGGWSELGRGRIQCLTKQGYKTGKPIQYLTGKP